MVNTMSSLVVKIMNKNKIQMISCLVLFLLMFDFPSFAYVGDRYILLDSRMGGVTGIGDSGKTLGEGLGTFFRVTMKNKKLKNYIKTCNDPLLDALEPEEAMKLIIQKGIKCSGKQSTNKAGK